MPKEALTKRFRKMDDQDTRVTSTNRFLERVAVDKNSRREGMEKG
jgi:hypothetical protein